MTFRAKPRWSRSAKSCALLASQGVYLRSGAYGNSAPGPNTWQCASTLPGGTRKRGLLGPSYQSSQPLVFSNGPLTGLAAAVMGGPQSTYFRPAFSSGSRILYMSRPRTPEASFARLSPSLASRAAAAATVFSAQAFGTTTTPSSSATIASPGLTSAPAQTTGMLTEPSVAFTVPLALTHLLQTGKPISVSVLTSRTPASMTSARAPRALNEVASRSPKKPSVHSAVIAATTMSPG